MGAYNRLPYHETGQPGRLGKELLCKLTVQTWPWPDAREDSMHEASNLPIGDGETHTGDPGVSKERGKPSVWFPVRLEEKKGNSGG